MQIEAAEQFQKEIFCKKLHEIILSECEKYALSVENNKDHGNFYYLFSTEELKF